MIAAAAGHSDSFSSPRPSAGISYAWWLRQQASLAEARVALPPDQFAKAWADGERMGLEQAADLILASIPPRSASPTVQLTTGRHPPATGVDFRTESGLNSVYARPYGT